VRICRLCFSFSSVLSLWPNLSNFFLFKILLCTRTEDSKAQFFSLDYLRLSPVPFLHLLPFSKFSFFFGSLRIFNLVNLLPDPWPIFYQRFPPSFRPIGFSPQRFPPSISLPHENSFPVLEPTESPPSDLTRSVFFTFKLRTVPSPVASPVPPHVKDHLGYTVLLHPLLVPLDYRFSLSPFSPCFLTG